MQQVLGTLEFGQRAGSQAERKIGCNPNPNPYPNPNADPDPNPNPITLSPYHPITLSSSPGRAEAAARSDRPRPSSRRGPG